MYKRRFNKFFKGDVVKLNKKYNYTLMVVYDFVGKNSGIVKVVETNTFKKMQFHHSGLELVRR